MDRCTAATLEALQISNLLANGSTVTLDAARRLDEHLIGIAAIARLNEGILKVFNFDMLSLNLRALRRAGGDSVRLD